MTNRRKSKLKQHAREEVKAWVIGVCLAFALYAVLNFI